MTKRSLLLVVALGATATLAITLGITITGTAAPSGQGSLARFEHQKITWHSCQVSRADQAGAELDAVGARCATVTVPLDYRHPGGRTISVAVAFRPATHPHPLGTLVVNVGGPGPSRNGVVVLAKGGQGIAPRRRVRR